MAIEEEELLTEEEEERESPERRSFRYLKEAFERRVSLIPAECHEAIFWWYRASRIQKHRIAMENILRQLTDVAGKVFWSGNIPEPIRAALASEIPFLDAAEETIRKKGKVRIPSLRRLEETAVKNCEQAFEGTHWYREVAVPAAEGEGMGPMVAGALLWIIGSPRRFGSFGKLIRYAGLDVVDGKAPRRRKGEKGHDNPKLRKTLYMLSQAWRLPKACPEGIWRARWDAWKAWYAENRPHILNEVSKKGVPCGRGHIHNMARRKVQRQFLKNLWVLWREYEKERGASYC